MSMLGLLRLHGVNAPRIVTATGGLVVGGTSSAGISLSPHTFHGGEQTIATAPSSEEIWWKADGAQDRDREQMAQWFPGFVEVTETGEAPRWRGTIDSGRGKHVVDVIHQIDHSLPRVEPHNRRLGRSRRGLWNDAPHRYLNGNLCVAASDDWNPTEDSIATVVAWVAHWYACYADWFASDRWPVSGYLNEVA